MALLRAVSVIQPPGLAGTPSRGQRATALANASCTASSARSKSPTARIRAATARPDSRRNTWSTAAAGSTVLRAPFELGEVDDRPDLDRAVPAARARAGGLQGV